MFNSKIFKFKKNRALITEISGHLLKNSKYDSGESENKYLLELDHSTIELVTPRRLDDFLASCVWESIVVHGHFVSENAFKVSTARPFSLDPIYFYDWTKKNDLDFFKKQIADGFLIQPQTLEWAC